MTDEAYRTEYFGLDERTAQSARDVMDILVGNALAISALDLDTGELRLIKRGIELPQIEADKPMLFSTFNNLLIAQRLIHPEDGDGYLRGTALSALRTVFFGGEKQVYLRYRQKVDGEYRWVALAIVAGKRCESGCAQVAMVLSGASGSGHANRPSEPRGVDYDCDPLTGLLNRRRFERDLEWWGRNRPETLTCVYIDVVGLHEINNHLGHKAGDGMLCAVAGAMQRMFPLADTYRIGGDEFVVLWADHTGEQGAEAAARIKVLLRESNYEISVGVHQIELDENLEDGVDRAENAMRRDKEAYYRETGNLDQMRDNIAAMQDFAGLSADERSALDEAQRELAAIPLIPCTTCNYCAKVCPRDIGISGTFTGMNYLTLYGDKAAALHQEGWLVGGHGHKRANECIGCGAGERACPQHIAIRDELARCVEALGIEG